LRLLLPINSGSDEARFAAASDEVINDVNLIALSNSKFRKINPQWILLGLHTPCNAVIDSSLQDQGKLSVTFNGLDCSGNRFRRGTITLQLPYDRITKVVTPWSDAKCTMIITFNDFTIKRMDDGKLFTFNGSENFTNVNGGLIDNSPGFEIPIVHHITGMIKLTFDNDLSRVWNIDRTRTTERANNVTKVITTGNANENGYSNVSAWGINRQGNIFTSTINTPVVLSSVCNYNEMVGIKVIHGEFRDLTITYGVDQDGNPAIEGCPYGYKLSWIDKEGNTIQKVFGY